MYVSGSPWNKEVVIQEKPRNVYTNVTSTYDGDTIVSRMLYIHFYFLPLIPYTGSGNGYRKINSYLVLPNI